MPENTVYVGRGNQFGNPFVVGKDGDPFTVVSKYAFLMNPYRHYGPTSTLYYLFLSMANIESIQSALIELIANFDFSKKFDQSVANNIRDKFLITAVKKITVDADLIIQGELGELDENEP